MSDRKEQQSQEALITVKAIDIHTKEIIASGSSEEHVIRQAEESGDEYILDYETNANYNFIL